MWIQGAGAGHCWGRVRRKQREAGVLGGGRGSANMALTRVSFINTITNVTVTTYINVFTSIIIIISQTANRIV